MSTCVFKFFYFMVTSKVKTEENGSPLRNALTVSSLSGGKASNFLIRIYGGAGICFRLC